MARHKMKGLWTNRFKQNPLEEVFAYAWARENAQGSLLAHLLDERALRGALRPPEPSERDQVVAATVIQWLGSPVGEHFLEERGFKREKKHV